MRSLILYVAGILIGVTASVSVAAGEPALPLKVSDGKLVDQNGTPFLINGDAAWSLMTAVTKSEAEDYLKDRKKKGFNAVLVNLIEHEFNGPKNRDGQLPFLRSGDFSNPNETYFEHADWIIRKAAEANLVVFLTPAYLGYGCGSQGWCREMVNSGPAEMRRYGRWLGARYKTFPNIVWVIGGDTDARAHRGASQAVEALVDGMTEEDDGHVYTAHCDRGNSALDCYDRPWLDLNSTYADCERAPSKLRADYERRSKAPFFFIEGKYEGEGASPTCIRAQAYWSVLSGAAGHIYGSSPTWSFNPGWEADLDAAGGSTLRHFADLFASRPSSLAPDFRHLVLTGGYGDIDGPDYAASALSSDGSTFIAYVPTKRTLTIDLASVSGSSSKVWWFNPRNGRARLSGVVSDSSKFEIEPPNNDDWVLVIDDASRDFSSPGEVEREEPAN